MQNGDLELIVVATSDEPHHHITLNLSFPMLLEPP
jgi:hypothetical protein